MKTERPISAAEPMDRMGRDLARLLTQASGDLPHDLSERLRVARQQALAVRKPEAPPAFELATQGNRLALAGGDSGLGLWGKLGSALPLLALLAGLVAMQVLVRDNVVSELAEIDTALLVDDLPPAAYSDPGFKKFLRQNGAESRAQD